LAFNTSLSFFVTLSLSFHISLHYWLPSLIAWMNIIFISLHFLPSPITFLHAIDAPCAAMPPPATIAAATRYVRRWFHVAFYARPDRKAPTRRQRTAAVAVMNTAHSTRMRRADARARKRQASCAAEVFAAAS